MDEESGVGGSGSTCSLGLLKEEKVMKTGVREDTGNKTNTAKPRYNVPRHNVLPDITYFSNGSHFFPQNHESR